MKKTASLLLGSGFSLDAGLPSVGQINEDMSNIAEENIYIDSGMRAMFLSEPINDPLTKGRREEHHFVQEFIDFYKTKVLNDPKDFNYEKFYDFFSLYMFEGKDADLIEGFCQKVSGREDPIDKNEDINRIAAFHRTFSQLLAEKLFKPEFLHESTTTGHPGYSCLLDYLTALLDTHDVKVHTLNHDLFFEWLANYASGLSHIFSDGFEYEGSPFYAKMSRDFKVGDSWVRRSYKIKLAQFTGKYDKALCLYKLHGSIFNTIVYNEQEQVRVRTEYGTSEFSMEKKNPHTGEYEFVGLWDDVVPDFLSGTTNKIRYYKADKHYAGLLEHFERNLMASDILLVIGYGFGDSGINDLLEKFYLKNGKEIVVIDPGEPNPEFLEGYKVNHIRSKLKDITANEFKQLLPK